MFPWVLLWAPQWAPQFQLPLHLPLSGDVAQRIAPRLVLDAITTEAGDREVEQRVLTEVASYGRQLGLIITLLLDLARQAPPATPEGQRALDQLAEIARRVEALKAAHTG